MLSSPRREAAQAAFAAFKEAKEDIKTWQRSAIDKGTSALHWAMNAGDAAIAPEQFAPSRGKQKFLKESAEAPLSTIKLCIKLAEGRSRIEGEMANMLAKPLTIRGAIRLLTPQAEKREPKKSAKTI